ncbi:hypothetical protein TCDM_08416 [Trypanosoma cruzi Dm28c]|uniref:Uncharacterized protein n=1 Tax=Trypanosoma cruzi Dm28c TaxID=1416333 RepID=V5BGW7_TRYCR|nr:hypothetical protein TCDM_08416 [Trypanosoma cruzi Dm28c]
MHSCACLARESQRRSVPIPCTNTPQNAAARLPNDHLTAIPFGYLMDRAPLAGGHATQKKQHNALRSCGGYRPTTTTQIRMILLFATTPLKWHSVVPAAPLFWPPLAPFGLIARSRCTDTNDSPTRSVLFLSVSIIIQACFRNGSSSVAALLAEALVLRPLCADAVLYRCTHPALLVTCSRFANKWASGVSPPSRISCCFLASVNSSVLLAVTSNRRRRSRTGRGIAASLVRCRTPSGFFMRGLCPTAMSCSTSHTSASRFSQYCATSLAQISMCSDSLACLSRNFGKARTALLNLTRLAFGSTPCANPG